MPDNDVPISKRTYLLMKALAAGAELFTALEAVSSTAIEHPEWELELPRTYSEWERT